MPETRGRMSRIQQLPPKIKKALDGLLVSGVSQAEILRRLNPELKAAAKKPLSAAGLNRYSSKMEKMGRRIRESREIAEVWTGKFGEAPQGDVGQMIIEMLRTMAYDLTLAAGAAGATLDTSIINDLALAVQRLEKAADISVKRERELRQEMARQAEVEVKKQGISPDIASAIRTALDQVE